MPQIRHYANCQLHSMISGGPKCVTRRRYTSHCWAMPLPQGSLLVLTKRVAGGPPSPKIKEKNMCHPSRELNRRPQDRSPIQVLTELNIA